MALLYYLYTFIRKMNENSHAAPDYAAVPTNEFEMSVGKSINTSNSINSELELVSDNENQNLVDYEIKPEGKYKRGKKKNETVEKKNEF